MLQLRPTAWGHPRSRAAQGGRAGLWLTTAACVFALTLVRLCGQSYTCELLGGCDTPAVSRFSYSELLPSEQVEHSRTLAEEASGSGEGASGNDGELGSGSADISSGDEDSGDITGDTGSGSGFFEPPAVPPPSPVPPLNPGETRVEVVEFELTLGLERRRLQAAWTDSLLADLHAALRQVLGLPRQNVLLTPVGSVTTVHAIPGGGRTAVQIVQQFLPAAA
ncbi:hypothetical protein AB1Y20_015240 [Prymnesium parvum]|uniref:Uncharacterized protein n=1 Tax=Prymnesium parvum TaxID=97485 RepID=A0AB34K0Y7_PRYPA